MLVRGPRSYAGPDAPHPLALYVSLTCEDATQKYPLESTISTSIGSCVRCSSLRPARVTVRRRSHIVTKIAHRVRPHTAHRPDARAPYHLDARSMGNLPEMRPGSRHAERRPWVGGGCLSDGDHRRHLTRRSASRRGRRRSALRSADYRSRLARALRNVGTKASVEPWRLLASRSRPQRPRRTASARRSPRPASPTVHHRPSTFPAR
jgi:hypothetical protein